jgi:hypothetical protein
MSKPLCTIISSGLNDIVHSSYIRVVRDESTTWVSGIDLNGLSTSMTRVRQCVCNSSHTTRLMRQTYVGSIRTSNRFPEIEIRVWWCHIYIIYQDGKVSRLEAVKQELPQWLVERSALALIDFTPQNDNLNRYDCYFVIKHTDTTRYLKFNLRTDRIIMKRTDAGHYNVYRLEYVPSEPIKRYEKENSEPLKKIYIFDKELRYCNTTRYVRMILFERWLVMMRVLLDNRVIVDRLDSFDSGVGVV